MGRSTASLACTLPSLTSARVEAMRSVVALSLPIIMITPYPVVAK